MKNQSKFFAFVGLVFFPFVVDWLLKDDNNDYDLSENELLFIKAYKQIGWLILFGFLLVVLLYLLGLYLFFDLFISLANLLVILLFIFLFINVFYLFLGKMPLGVGKKLSLKTNRINLFDENLFFYYMPILSYYLYLKKNFKEGYISYIKEASFFWFILGLVGLLSFSFSISNLFYLLLFLIIVRIVSLLFGIDIPIIKNVILNIYEKFPYEILVYIEALFYYLFNNLISLFKGNLIKPYKKNFSNIKEFYLYGYEVNNILKTPKKYLFILLSYVVLFFFLGYSLYLNIKPLNIVVVFSILILLSYFILPYFIEKKVYPIPFISLILFYILKVF